MRNSKGWVFLGLVAGCVAMIGLYLAMRRPAGVFTESDPLPVSAPALQEILADPHVFYRNTRLDADYGRLAVASLERPEERLATGLSCERLDVRAGIGVCLTADRGVTTTYSAVIFTTRDFAPGKTIALTGIPSRVRLSPDGRLAGVTVFVSGHAYSQSQFSTLTTLLDTERGEILGDLESFNVVKDGRAFRREDFNYWGVTFARDSRTFYATLSSGGVFYLVRADAAARQAVVIAEGVECPSLSPDNRRIAFKRREVNRGQLVWRIAVLELETGAQTVLAAESRNVDDQMAWRDNDRVLYSLPSDQQAGSLDIWSAGWNGVQPELFVKDAYSPALP